MWYEILPSYLAITTFLAIPNLFVYFTNQLVLNQPYKRRINSNEIAYQYLRDGRLSHRNWAYDFAGLDNIPDVDQPAQQQKPTSSC